MYSFFFYCAPVASGCFLGSCVLEQHLSVKIIVWSMVDFRSLCVVSKGNDILPDFGLYQNCASSGGLVSSSVFCCPDCCGHGESIISSGFRRFSQHFVGGLLPTKGSMFKIDAPQKFNWYPLRVTHVILFGFCFGFLGLFFVFVWIFCCVFLFGFFLYMWFWF